jgi:hypothetical protein
VYDTALNQNHSGIKIEILPFQPHNLAHTKTQTLSHYYIFPLKCVLFLFQSFEVLPAMDDRSGDGRQERC